MFVGYVPQRVPDANGRWQHTGHVERVSWSSHGNRKVPLSKVDSSPRGLKSVSPPPIVDGPSAHSVDSMEGTSSSLANAVAKVTPTSVATYRCTKTGFYYSSTRLTRVTVANFLFVFYGGCGGISRVVRDNSEGSLPRCLVRLVDSFRRLFLPCVGVPAQCVLTRVRAIGAVITADGPDSAPVYRGNASGKVHAVVAVNSMGKVVRLRGTGKPSKFYTP